MRISNNYRVRQHDFVTSKFPTILHVCRESRIEAKRTYILAFHSPKYSVPVYFNFEKDTLYIRARAWEGVQLNKVIQMLPQKELVQRIAMSSDLWPGRFPQMEVRGLGSANLLRFPALKTIFICHQIDRYGLFSSHSTSCTSNVSCMMDIRQVKLSGYMTGSITDVAKHLGTQVELNVAKFLGELRGGKLGENPWQKEPRFVYKALCERGILQKSFSCPPLRLANRGRRLK
jgi:hypothetical protein